MHYTENSVRGEAEAEELSHLEDLCEEFRTPSARYRVYIEYANNVIHSLSMLYTLQGIESA